MNKFLFSSVKCGRQFATFDEHINWLNAKIKEDEECIQDCKEKIEDYKKEIEKVKEEKERIESNPETYVPTVYLDGWQDTPEKKQTVYDWCQAHEIKYHPEVVGNYAPGMSYAKPRPNYEFITARSNTSVIRYVRCIDCYEKALETGENTDDYEKYLK